MAFLLPCSGSGWGDGLGSGSGRGDGWGSGSGSGSCSGSGSGRGDGSGSGWGDGSCSGSGRGDGWGSGSGSGDGSGWGSGDGDGWSNIVKVGAQRIYNVDYVPTAIYSIHGNYARCGVLQQDFTFKPCYIARVEDSFAHGDTLQQAIKDAREKAMRNMPVEERVEQFLSTYPDPEALIPAKELFNWHNILTGSCLLGRKQFCGERGIDVEHDNFSVKDFIKLTINSYGGDVIAKLQKRLDAH